MATRSYSVGQPLWFVPSASRFGKQREICIQSIGRKWITAGDYRFDKDTLRADSNGYMSPGQAYLNKADYDMLIALNKAWVDLAESIKKLPVWAPRDLSLERIQQAHEKIQQAQALLFGKETN